jgi:hypothetical protein
MARSQRKRTGIGVGALNTRIDNRMILEVNITGRCFCNSFANRKFHDLEWKANRSSLSEIDVVIFWVSSTRTAKTNGSASK